MTKTRKAPKTAWTKGRSGNPAGKAAGTRNKATQMIVALMEEGAKEIATAIITAAKAGDLGAARLVLDRLAPPLRERSIQIALPDTDTAEGVAQAQQAILCAVGSGELMPGEGTALVAMVESRRRAIETVEHERRIRELERLSESKGTTL